ncbi:MAG: hypothetical protein CML01_11490 [Pseudomonas sp.]|nr:hypothetical protein [Pseudomonas sp.]|tara:strand:- start:49031 stop:49237 length:207 start_codon:yes stop_codon:yes gene_type:complete
MSAPVRLALWALERSEWSWRQVNEYLHFQRKKTAAKAAALIAHDRILTGEIVSRGVPSFYRSYKDASQ